MGKGKRDDKDKDGAADSGANKGGTGKSTDRGDRGGTADGAGG